MVIISHSYALLGRERDEPLLHSVNLLFSGIGVSGFFVLSGFLIYQSVLNTTTIGVFIKKRFWRIFPGLIVVVLLCSLILGPLVSSLSFRAYFTSTQTYDYLLRNILLIPSDNILPGVFQHNFVPVINGSLWTLRYEVLCYGGMLLFYFIPINRHKAFAFAAYLFLLFGNIAITYHWIKLSPALYYHLGNMFTLASYFYAGVVLQQYSAYWLPYVNKIALCSLLLALLISIITPQIMPDVVTFLYPIVILSVGSTYLPQLQIGERIGDISYGTYIYAFPIQQSLVMAGVNSVGQLILFSLLLSWLAGWLSYNVVEKRFAYKRRNLIATV